MRRYILLFCFFAIAAFSTNLIAQKNNDPRDRERVEALHVAFITQKLDLSATESQKFWPIYNEYRGKVDGLRNKYKKDNSSLDNSIAFDQERLALKKDYFEKLKAVVPTDKLDKLENAEREFKKELIDKMKEENPKK